MTFEATEDRRRQDLAQTIRRVWEAGPPFRPILLVGGIGDGKTTTGMELAASLRSAGLPIAGILAPRILGARETVGYTVVALDTDHRHQFASLSPGRIRIGRFSLDEAGLRFADDALHRGATAGAITFIDEVGRLELHGGGHAARLREILRSTALPILMVRDTLAHSVIDRFGLREPFVFPVAALSTKTVPAQDHELFWDVVDSLPFPLLVTVDATGYPRSRPMRLLEHDQGVLWFATSGSSNKIAQIRERPEVTVLFVDAQRFDYASFHGVARVVEDPDRKRQLWQEEWAEDWPGGPTDSDYVLLRIAGHRGFYHQGATGQRGEIHLSSDSQPTR